ncbi:MAG: hypothetical protein JWN43_331, partial [Gammaproteobacteria bacterium]|nr:hypothetical protein [Gammaproteobacteria bacterium]
AFTEVQPAMPSVLLIVSSILY